MTHDDEHSGFFFKTFAAEAAPIEHEAHPDLDLLYASLQGDIAPDVQSKLSGHLATCEACRLRWKTLQRHMQDATEVHGARSRVPTLDAYVADRTAPQTTLADWLHSLFEARTFAIAASAAVLCPRTCCRYSVRSSTCSPYIGADPDPQRARHGASGQVGRSHEPGQQHSQPVLLGSGNRGGRSEGLGLGESDLLRGPAGRQLGGDRREATRRRRLVAARLAAQPRHRTARRRSPCRFDPSPADSAIDPVVRTTPGQLVRPIKPYAG